MANWTISITGTDDGSNEPIAYERALFGKVNSLVAWIRKQQGIVITTGIVDTPIAPSRDITLSNSYE